MIFCLFRLPSQTDINSIYKCMCCYLFANISLMDTLIDFHSFFEISLMFVDSRRCFLGVFLFLLCRRLHCWVLKGCAEGIYFSITQKTKAWPDQMKVILAALARARATCTHQNHKSDQKLCRDLEKRQLASTEHLTQCTAAFCSFPLQGCYGQKATTENCCCPRQGRYASFKRAFIHVICSCEAIIFEISFQVELASSMLS